MNTDFFGIGSALKGCAQIYFRSARNSGRTLSMVNSLKDGDRVVFSSMQMARHVEKLCKERNIKLDYIVVSPQQPQGLFERGTSKGRTIFDHEWVEQFYIDSLERTEKQISHWERETSGYGEAHIQTKRKAEEIQKWRF